MAKIKSLKKRKSQILPILGFVEFDDKGFFELPENEKSKEFLNWLRKQPPQTVSIVEILEGEEIEKIVESDYGNRSNKKFTVEEIFEVKQMDDEEFKDFAKKLPKEDFPLKERAEFIKNKDLNGLRTWVVSVMENLEKVE